MSHYREWGDVISMEHEEFDARHDQRGRAVCRALPSGDPSRSCDTRPAYHPTKRQVRSSHWLNLALPEYCSSRFPFVVGNTAAVWPSSALAATRCSCCAPMVPSFLSTCLRIRSHFNSTLPAANGTVRSASAAHSKCVHLTHTNHLYYIISHH